MLVSKIFGGGGVAPLPPPPPPRRRRPCRTMDMIGLCETTFKLINANHKISFNHARYIKEQHRTM